MTQAQVIKRFFHNNPSDPLLQTLLQEGFTWSQERSCYFMDTEKFRHWNNKPADLTPTSVASDAFHRATYPPFSVDCGTRNHDS